MSPRRPALILREGFKSEFLSQRSRKSRLVQPPMSAVECGNCKVEDVMPLSRLKDEYLVQDSVRFFMTNEDGSSVACRVSHEALRDMLAACTLMVQMARCSMLAAS
jgi:hypothetical protein